MAKPNLKKLKIALVHEYLVKLGGGERVLKALVDLFPKADIFTIVHNPKMVYKILKRRKKIKSSFLQNFPGAIKKYQLYLWLMPKAVESLDFSKYDLVISGCHSYAKGIIVPEKTLHICYCHTPIRYLWLNPKEHIEKWQFFGPAKKLIPFEFIFNQLRKWDLKAAQKPNVCMANSFNVQKRIKKYYNRNSGVLYSPIDWNFWRPTKSKKSEDFFLYISRLEPHKKPDLAVSAFNRTEQSLKVVGVGSLKEKLKEMAGPEIEFLGKVSDQKLRDLYSQATAVIFPQEEDFGLVPLEAAACGTPTLAFKKGGALETVIKGVTGEFFEKPTVKSLADAVKKFKPEKFDSKILRKHAKQFSIQQFQKNVKKLIEKEYSKHGKSF